MARLNEPPQMSTSSDTVETLRRKMLRQNRDLAKSNNVRALRIRELENEMTLMLSENLQLRSRIIELEKELQDNEARRIADHALAIKAKLEGQLLEWATLIGGLGLEPPIKKYSPRIGRPSSTTKRLSFSSCRPSPSQRRLRDIARDVEELGRISETKPFCRESMNHQQLLALQSEANQSPAPKPPPLPRLSVDHLDQADSPTKYSAIPQDLDDFLNSDLPASLASPKRNKGTPNKDVSSPLVTPQPSTPKETQVSESPLSHQKIAELPITRQACLLSQACHDQAAINATIGGAKRKLEVMGGSVTLSRPRKNENEPPPSMVAKHARENGGDRMIKPLRSTKKGAAPKSRKPLAAKSTNLDVVPPKDEGQIVTKDDVSVHKPDSVLTQTSNENSKSRSKSQAPPVNIDTTLAPTIEPPVVTELETPVAEALLLSPHSPERPSIAERRTSDTPPPVDISSLGETSRPSRRNRTAVSYAEPNLRDKMRRPTKELLDAVAGEGKYSRRSSQADLVCPIMSDGL